MTASSPALLTMSTRLPAQAAAVAKLAAMDNVRLLTRTTAFGYYAQNFVGLTERVTDHLVNPGHDLPRERLWQVRAKKVVLATGAIERQMVFADNDRPGVMLASAARTYLNHYGVAVGKNVGECFIRLYYLPLAAKECMERKCTRQ